MKILKLKYTFEKCLLQGYSNIRIMIEKHLNFSFKVEVWNVISIAKVTSETKSKNYKHHRKVDTLSARI